MRKIIFKSVIKKKRPNKTKAILIYNLYSKFNSVFRNISILLTPILDFPYSLLAHPWALWINLNPTKQTKNGSLQPRHTREKGQIFRAMLINNNKKLEKLEHRIYRQAGTPHDSRFSH
jgi:hypothetical protein